MEIDYGDLERASTSLKNAARRLHAEVGLHAGLGSASPSAEAAYEEVAMQRRLYVRELAALAEAHSKACLDTIELFRLLDAQVALSTDVYR